MNTNNNIEKEILELVKQKVSPIEYESYLSQLKYNSNASKSDIAFFYAPNMLLCKHIQSKYSPLLKEILSQNKIGMHLTHSVDVRIEVASKVQVSERPSINYKATKSSIKDSYTFENFVVGSCNHTVYEIAKEIAQSDTPPYNPVLFYGGTGLGKTHILNAIGNHALEKHKKVVLVTSEDFLRDFLKHLNNKTMDSFKEKYRNCDFFLLDDAQFLQGKPQLEEEFFHTFNELHANSKQIVLISDRSPKNIAGLEDRLKSRFEWGITAKIMPPDLETKLSIVKQKCQLNKITLPEDVMEYIAQNISDNIRQMEGAIIKISVNANLMNAQIDLNLAKTVLEDLQKDHAEGSSLENILLAVAQSLNLKSSEITNKKSSRQKNVALARKLVVYFARLYTPNPTLSLAQFLDLKDHSSISKSYSSIKKSLEEKNPFILSLREEIKNRLNELNDKKTTFSSCE
ncbi:chromosomal replication initiator protein DnaA [Helicobacter cetorum]|uniref:Chromosomal replication initiator protein DnaA n=1 Tax=Helicobacter cetorum (strain ATCC BAA-540 / CCUG 52418 / MIT 99-5656) TaxID=1163745 RepID=I0ESK8_HELCM|nr:chromosomal replication initiator protein DnaA [Helicobacter cetorum]AFI05927.1 chromosomal replication initiation protein [Helicobacter cetorum MIT 99-5656]